MNIDIGMILAALPALWLLLALLLRALYPRLAPRLARLEPLSRAVTLRQLAGVPLAIAASIAVLLYLPGSPLLPTHCHDAHCMPHAPHTAAGWWLLVPLALLTFPSLIHDLRVLLESRRLQRQWRHLSDAEEGYRVIDSDNPLACTLGLWQPEIYLSRGLLQQLTADQIEIIVAHESAHRMRRDNVWLWLTRISTLRLCGQLCRDIEAAQEEACDRSAAAIRGELAVAETLLRCARLMQQPHQLACAFFRDSLRQRVQALLTPTDGQLPRGAALWLPVAIPLIATATVVPLHLLLESMH